LTQKLLSTLVCGLKPGLLLLFWNLFLLVVAGAAVVVKNKGTVYCSEKFGLFSNFCPGIGMAKMKGEKQMVAELTRTHAFTITLTFMAADGAAFLT
jgi:hypothetical protein